MSSICFGDAMVPIIEYDYILLSGYSTLHKEYYLTRFNHQTNTTPVEIEFLKGGDPRHKGNQPYES